MTQKKKKKKKNAVIGIFNCGLKLGHIDIPYLP